MNRLILSACIVFIWFIVILAFPPYSPTGRYGTELLASSSKPQGDLTEFNKSVAKIKEYIGIKGNDTILYFQKAWLPAEISGTDTLAPFPALYEGEFLSSQREIRAYLPTYPYAYFSIPHEVDIPEEIIVRAEKKMSDTLFYYNYPSKRGMVEGMDHTYKPIGCITPRGEILPFEEYLISKSYLSRKVGSFLWEIVQEQQRADIK